MKEPIRLLIVEDHPLMAQATKDLLEELESVQVVGVAADGCTALQLVEEHNPDIVFLDFNLPDIYGDEVLKKIKTAHPHIHVIIFTGFDISDLFNHLIELKVSGIISKEEKGEVYLAMIQSVMQGHTVVPLHIFQQMRINGTKMSEQILTNDEQSIMEMVIKGFTNEQIAEEIHMSKRSVDNYLKKVYQKYGVKSRAQAIKKYLETN
ncbi:MAG TPA: response regulator transcription factor [Bacilli bacterium]